MDVPQLLIHDRRDNVGVVVVEGLHAGEEMLCIVTEDNSEFKLVSKQDVPIGHKIALRDLSPDDTVVKNGVEISSTLYKDIAAITESGRGND